MRHDRRQTADVIGDARCPRFKPAWLSHCKRFQKTADNPKIQTAYKAQEPLYAKGERKRIDSFFYSLLISKPYGVRAITADSTRTRFVPELFRNPAVRVPVPAGTVKPIRCRAGWHDWAKVLDDDDRWCRQCLRCGEVRP